VITVGRDERRRVVKGVEENLSPVTENQNFEAVKGHT